MKRHLRRALLSLKNAFRQNPRLYHVYLWLGDVLKLRPAAQYSGLTPELIRQLFKNGGSLPGTSRGIPMYRLRHLYQRIILSCIRHRCGGWWMYPRLMPGNAVPLLKALLREVLLRQSAEDRVFLRFTQELKELHGDKYESDRAVLRVRTGVPSNRQMADALRIMLFIAELHPAARDSTAALREAAGQIWREGKPGITARSRQRYVEEIARGLWHFDLPQEAEECLRLSRDTTGMADFIAANMNIRKENENWAASLRAANAGKGFTVLGATIWGSDYINFFLRYHLPCLLAKGNIPHLGSASTVVFSIVTNAPGKAEISAHPSFARLSEFVQWRFSVCEDIPSRTVLEHVHMFYPRYGMLDHQHVYFASALRADLFLIPPDCILSGNGLMHLKRYLEEGYGCSSVANIEVDRRAVTPYFEQRMDENLRLELNAGELIQLAVQHKTDGFRSLMVSGKSHANPYPREFFWRVQGGYMCHSLFMHPFAISSRMLSRPFHPNHENVDWALIPRLLQADGRMKVVEDATEVAMLHCGDKDARGRQRTNYQYVITPRLMRHILRVHSHDYPVHRECFNTAQFFPCEDAEFPVSDTYSTDVARMRRVFEATADHEPVCE